MENVGENTGKSLSQYLLDNYDLPSGRLQINSYILESVLEFGFEEALDFELDIANKYGGLFFLSHLSLYPHIISENLALCIEISSLLSQHIEELMRDLGTHYYGYVDKFFKIVEEVRSNPRAYKEKKSAPPEKQGDSAIRQAIKTYYASRRTEKESSYYSGEELAEQYLRNYSSRSDFTRFVQTFRREVAVGRLKGEVNKKPSLSSVGIIVEKRGKKILYSDGSQSQLFPDVVVIKDSPLFLVLTTDMDCLIVNGDTKASNKLGSIKELGIPLLYRTHNATVNEFTKDLKAEDCFFDPLSLNTVFKDGKVLISLNNLRGSTQPCILYIKNNKLISKIDAYIDRIIRESMLFLPDGFAFIDVFDKEGKFSKVVYYRDDGTIKKSQPFANVERLFLVSDALRFVATHDREKYYLVDGKFREQYFYTDDDSIMTRKDRINGTYKGEVVSLLFDVRSMKAILMTQSGIQKEYEIPRGAFRVDNSYFRITRNGPLLVTPDTRQIYNLELGCDRPVYVSNSREITPIKIDGELFFQETDEEKGEVRIINVDFETVCTYPASANGTNTYLFRKPGRREELLALIRQEYLSQAAIDSYFSKYYPKGLLSAYLEERKAKRKAVKDLLQKSSSRRIIKEIEKNKRVRIKRRKIADVPDRARGIVKKIFPKLDIQDTLVEKSMRVISTQINIFRVRTGRLFGPIVVVASALSSLLLGAALKNALGDHSIIDLSEVPGNRFTAEVDPKLNNRVELMKLEERPREGEIVVTMVYDRYDQSADRWYGGSLPYPYTQYDASTTYTLENIQGSGTIVLPTNVNSMVSNVIGITEEDIAVAVNVEYNNLGVSIIDLRENPDVVKIRYDVLSNTHSKDLQDISQEEYDSFKERFITEYGTALSEELVKLPDFIIDFLDSIKDRRPKEKLTLIREYLASISFYDWDNAVVGSDKAEVPLQERLEIMQRRMGDIKKEFQSRLELKDKKFAVICQDAAQIEVAVLRRAGFLAGLEQGYSPGSNVVYTNDAHLIGDVVWPEGDSYKRIACDSTPSSANHTQVESSNSFQKEILELINKVITPELYLAFLSIFYILKKKYEYIEPEKPLPEKETYKEIWEREDKEAETVLQKRIKEEAEDINILANREVSKFVDIISERLLWHPKGLRSLDKHDLDEIAASVGHQMALIRLDNDNLTTNEYAKNIFLILQDLVKKITEILSVSKPEAGQFLIDVFRDQKIRSICKIDDEKYYILIEIINKFKNTA